MILKWLILMSLVLAVTKTCDLDLVLEDLYDFSESEDDSSTEKPDKGQSGSKPQALAGNNSNDSAPSTTVKPANTAPEQNSTADSTTGRGIDLNSKGKHCHRSAHHRRHLVSKIPLPNVVRDKENLSGGRALYTGLDTILDRYAPLAELSVSRSLEFNPTIEEEDRVEAGDFIKLPEARKLVLIRPFEDQKEVRGRIAGPKIKVHTNEYIEDKKKGVLYVPIPRKYLNSERPGLSTTKNRLRKPFINEDNLFTISKHNLEEHPPPSLAEWFIYNDRVETRNSEKEEEEEGKIEDIEVEEEEEKRPLSIEMLLNKKKKKNTHHQRYSPIVHQSNNNFKVHTNKYIEDKEENIVYVPIPRKYLNRERPGLATEKNNINRRTVYRLREPFINKDNLFTISKYHLEENARPSLAEWFINNDRGETRNFEEEEEERKIEDIEPEEEEERRPLSIEMLLNKKKKNTHHHGYSPLVHQSYNNNEYIEDKEEGVVYVPISKIYLNREHPGLSIPKSNINRLLVHRHRKPIINEDKLFSIPKYSLEQHARPSLAEWFIYNDRGDKLNSEKGKGEGEVEEIEAKEEEDEENRRPYVEMLVKKKKNHQRYSLPVHQSHNNLKVNINKYLGDDEDTFIYVPIGKNIFKEERHELPHTKKHKHRRPVHNQRKPSVNNDDYLSTFTKHISDGRRRPSVAEVVIHKSDPVKSQNWHQSYVILSVPAKENKQEKNSEKLPLNQNDFMLQEQNPRRPILMNSYENFDLHQLPEEPFYDSVRSPSLNHLNQVKEHIIRETVKRNPADHVEVRNVYEQIRSSVIKNPHVPIDLSMEIQERPLNAKIPEMGEQNKAEVANLKEHQDHVAPNKLIVQQLPLINSNINRFQQGFSGLTPNPQNTGEIHIEKLHIQELPQVTPHQQNFHQGFSAITHNVQMGETRKPEGQHNIHETVQQNLQKLSDMYLHSQSYPLKHQMQPRPINSEHHEEPIHEQNFYMNPKNPEIDSMKHEHFPVHEHSSYESSSMHSSNYPEILAGSRPYLNLHNKPMQEPGSGYLPLNSPEINHQFQSPSFSSQPTLQHETMPEHPHNGHMMEHHNQGLPLVDMLNNFKGQQLENHNKPMQEHGLHQHEMPHQPLEVKNSTVPNKHVIINAV